MRVPSVPQCSLNPARVPLGVSTRTQGARSVPFALPVCDDGASFRMGSFAPAFCAALTEPRRAAILSATGHPLPTLGEKKSVAVLTALKPPCWQGNKSKGRGGGPRKPVRPATLQRADPLQLHPWKELPIEGRQGSRERPFCWGNACKPRLTELHRTPVSGSKGFKTIIRDSKRSLAFRSNCSGSSSTGGQAAPLQGLGTGVFPSQAPGCCWWGETGTATVSSAMSTQKQKPRCIQRGLRPLCTEPQLVTTALNTPIGEACPAGHSSE